ncbi:MAG: imidazole glycerol phosphate synthase cyclase subunit [Rubrivivax sp.]
MLKRRIIPKLLLKDGRNVKGVKFEKLRDTGSPVTNARIYDAQGADELVFLDIRGVHSPRPSDEKRGLLFDIIAKTAEEVFMPFCVGGGVKSLDDVRECLKAGADKVSVNTAAVESPELITRGAERFGVQCMVVSIDYRVHADGRAEVFTHGGTVATGLDPVEHAVKMAEIGAGELLVTSIDRDGTMEGYDLETLKRIVDRVKVPVIAAGGPGSLQHLVDAVKVADVSAVAVGSLFHFTDQSPIKARTFMKVAGIDVRAKE